MFSTLKKRLFLGLYAFLIISIPIGAYLSSQYQNIKGKASEMKNQETTLKQTPKPATSGAKDLLSASESNLQNASPSPESSSTSATSFGPTLSLNASLEGRLPANQATKLFVGIIEGTIGTNPKFLLSFTVDLPLSGSFSNLSLAGLTPGTRYTALLKGSAQIATSSAFIMSPAISSLNNGQPLNMLTGDVNDDNAIDSSDYSILQKAYGTNPNLANWNERADFNKDNIINSFDLSFISKNLGQVGASGAWTSPLPQTSTPSASLNSPSQGSPDGSKGYWIWVPNN